MESPHWYLCGSCVWLHQAWSSSSRLRLWLRQRTSSRCRWRHYNCLQYHPYLTSRCSWPQFIFSQNHPYLTNLASSVGITRAIGEGIVTRGDLFITSKLWNTYHRKEHVLLAAKRSLNDLNIQYFDLYLVHFPISMRFVPFEVRYPPSWVFDPTMAHPAIELDRVPFTETWTAMEELSTLGVAKNIGEMITVARFFENKSCTMISSNLSTLSSVGHNICATLEDWHSKITVEIPYKVCATWAPRCWWICCPIA